MSAEDVEFVREMLATFNRGEREKSLQYLDDDVELQQWGQLVDTGTYKGKNEWIRGIRLWLDEFSSFSFEPDELIDAGDAVFARILLRGVGRLSGAELVQEVFHVYEVRDGKLVRARVFGDEGDARRAAGLAG